ncbi:MAG: LysM peptidoglycan-binding domain-containing protein [Desulfohalobiaceae bacterium]|nr:LysM peptidoglycan-binding domain-containing protein [Desulfohalobiaceae bacterium]
MKRYLLLVFVVLFLTTLSGCCWKKVASEPAPAAPEVETVEPETVQPEEVPEPEAVPPTAMELYDQDYAELPLMHKVVKGECLWWISEYRQIYNDPFMWPLIYKANRDKINDPDLIYPGQVFYIPRTFGLDELKESRRSAGAPRPYLPPEDANLPTELRDDLGWEF